MVSCPQTYNFVHLSEEVKQKIDSAKKPRLVADDAPMGYPVPEKRVAKEKGLRSVIKMEDGSELNFYTLNPTGQKILSFVLPELFEHLGADVMNNLEIIL